MLKTGKLMEQASISGVFKIKKLKNVENCKTIAAGFRNFEKSNKDQTSVFKKTKTCKGES